MKILFACHDPPAPATNGGSIDMLGMCQALHDLGHDVDLVYTPKAPDTPVDKPRLDRACTRHWAIQRTPGVGAALAMEPYQLSSRAGLRTWAFDAAYDVVIASDHCAAILENPSIATRFRVLRRNNLEDAYARRMAEQAHNLLIKGFFWKESLLFKLWMQRTDPTVDQIWYVSTQELAQQSRSGQVDRKPDRRLVPSALGSRDVVPIDTTKFAGGRVLYFGSLTVPVNRASVDWYVREVHPLVRAARPDYRLEIAGRVTDDLSDWMQPHIGAADYVFHPNPPDSEVVYADGGIFIDPIAHDAGIKLKILEAVRRGYAIVCSSNSLTGSGLVAHQHARVASSAGEFAQAVIELLNSPEQAADLARAAQDRLRQHFDIERDVASALGALGAANGR
jgi:glycosyltransferase involved in cell wall biosynthesis